MQLNLTKDDVKERHSSSSKERERDGEIFEEREFFILFKKGILSAAASKQERELAELEEWMNIFQY
jgi:hypothetical protein